MSVTDSGRSEGPEAANEQGELSEQFEKNRAGSECVT